MTDYANFKGDRALELYALMWQAVAERNNITVPDAKRRFYLRKAMAEDFDGLAESDYSYDWSTDGDQITAAARFFMEPVERFECAGMYGWVNGNLATALNYLEIWLNNEKVREYFGYELSSEENGKYLLDDPVYATKTQVLKIIPNTTGASATAKAFPMVWVIKSK